MHRTCHTEALNIQIKKLHDRRKFLSNISLLLAVIGIVLMITEIEISSYNMKNDQKTSQNQPKATFFIKVIVSITTALLLVVLLLYHCVTVLLLMAQNSIDNWQLVVNYKWSLMVLVELLICGIHPIPLADSEYIWMSKRDYMGEEEQEKVPVNVLLTILMFLRGYLILRVMVLHSYIYDKSFHGGLDSVQRRNINTQFALKYLLTVYSRTFLISSVVFLFIWTCWGVRVCEIYEKRNDLEFANNIWFISVTFLTVGYGDIVPNTVCGRFVSIMAGTFGVVCTAYVVAIIAESMQLSYSEAYLHQFIIQNDLDKNMKNSAAAIFQNLWLIRKARAQKCNKYTNRNLLQRKMKLLKHIRNLKILKNEKIELEKKSLSISTIYSGQVQICQAIDKLGNHVNKMEVLVSKIAAAVDRSH